MIFTDSMQVNYNIVLCHVVVIPNCFQIHVCFFIVHSNNCNERDVFDTVLDDAPSSEQPQTFKYCILNEFLFQNGQMAFHCSRQVNGH